jgi:hypothetical protein
VGEPSGIDIDIDIDIEDAMDRGSDPGSDTSGLTAAVSGGDPDGNAAEVDTADDDDTDTLADDNDTPPWDCGDFCATAPCGRQTQDSPSAPGHRSHFFTPGGSRARLKHR